MSLPGISQVSRGNNHPTAAPNVMTSAATMSLMSANESPELAECHLHEIHPLSDFLGRCGIREPQMSLARWPEGRTR